MAIWSTTTVLILAWACLSKSNTTIHTDHFPNRWNNNECLVGDCVNHPPSDTLLAFTTANIRYRTVGFLASLASCDDSFDLLAVDEHSTDNTTDDLTAFGVRTLSIPRSVGVTALWNEAWQYFVQHGYDKLIYSNNDVLVPKGVIDKLRAALDAGCDLVSPLSTVRGKGHVGHIEGLEVCSWRRGAHGITLTRCGGAHAPNSPLAQVVHDLQGDAVALVTNPGNFRAVQHTLDSKYHGCSIDQVLWKHRKRFNGFFFAVSKRVREAAFSDALLFDPSNYNFQQVTHIVHLVLCTVDCTLHIEHSTFYIVHCSRPFCGYLFLTPLFTHTPFQEADLGNRLLALNMTMCVHRGTFVYHFKGATIPLRINREVWRRNDDV